MKLSFSSLNFFILFIVVFSCKSNSDKKDDSFTFIERNGYIIDSYNGLDYYRLSKTKQFMNGYYVVGNETTKWEEFEFKKGLLHGDYIVFHTNGEIFSHAKYVNGKRHGEELNYTQSGILLKKNNYKNDALSGIQYMYYDNGKVLSESKYKTGEFIESVSFDVLGNIISQSYIKDGRTITQKVIEGKVYSEKVSSNYDDYETIKYFNEDGSVKIYLRQIEEDNTLYVLELNENGEEIKRVDIKANPEKAIKYLGLLN